MAREGHRVLQRSVTNLAQRSAARSAAGCTLQLLDTAFDLIKSLVCLLRGLIGGFRALRRTLHAGVELIQA